MSIFLTGLKINLDGIGVLQIPNGLCGVQHDYEKWSESAWEDKINLTQEAKAKLSKVHKISGNYFLTSQTLNAKRAQNLYNTYNIFLRSCLKYLKH